ncbi:hypothetical protein EON65_07900 [archaeon]|nr:MAG: hypothetical protein EON65_07900 [archaeon]
MKCFDAQVLSSQVSGLLRALTSALIDATVVSFSLGTLLNYFMKPFAPSAAVAIFRTQHDNTFFRFSPKLITGRDFFRSKIQQTIEKNYWFVVFKFFEVCPSKINKNGPNQICQYDFYGNDNIVRPMKVLGKLCRA